MEERGALVVCAEHSRFHDRIKRLEEDVRNLNSAHNALKDQFHILQLTQIEDRGVIKNLDSKMEQIKEGIKELSAKLEKRSMPDSFQTFLTSLGGKIIMVGVVGGAAYALFKVGLEVFLK